MKDTCQCFPRADLFLERTRKMGDESVYSLTEPILLKGLPCADIKEKIDVVINYEERFSSRSPNVPSTSSTSVYYHHRPVGRKPQQLYNLRFEFHPLIGNGDGDPIAHVHLDTKIPDKYPESYELTDPVSEATQKNLFLLFRNSRIPTPLMPLPGVLCLLVADHYRSGVNELIEKALTKLDDFSTPPLYKEWHAKCFENQLHHGWSWYKY